MNRIITYAVDEDGIVVSRVGSDVAIPVLDFEAIGQGGDFTGPMKYDLEKFPVTALAPNWGQLRWTKKIPVRLKNAHRTFWGFKPLKDQEHDA